MIYVIGSGPSGVAASAALLEMGREVAMLDVGLELEPSRQENINQLKQLPRDQWPDELISDLKGHVQSNRRGVRFKKSYGSDFIFRNATFVENKVGQTDAKPTLAKGGFSNSWGAVTLPYLSRDIKDWPVSLGELEKHYRSVIGIIGMSGVNDDLENSFPVYGELSKPLNLSRQAERLLSIWKENKASLNELGFVFGRSRLAVNVENSSRGPGCVYCGLCLYGCPHELIYNASHTIKRFLDNPKFTYRSGIYVRKITESSAGIEIHATDVKNQEEVVFKASRVFLGAGVLSSTRIVLESLEAYNNNIAIRDSQYFILPFFIREKTQNVEEESLHTLCQLLLEVFDETLTPYTINLQLYTYNDLYSNVIRNAFAPFSSFAKPLLSFLLGKLVAFQGYLHSEDSMQMIARLKKKGDFTALLLEAKLNPNTRVLIRKLIWRINKCSHELGGHVLWPLHTVALPGEGNHYGCSFPMALKPSQFQTDLMGRPKEFKRVHLIDASVFPTIPATSITLTVMANAHRITSHALDS